LVEEQSNLPLGVILAGGPGRRLGGGKPWRTIGGKRLIDIALCTLQSVCPDCVIVTGDAAAMADQPCPVISDRWPGQGPLAAIATALLDTEAESILVMPVDMPLVDPVLLRLIIERSKGRSAVAPMGPRGPQPLLAFYHRSCLPHALRLLEQGERRPRIFLKLVKAELISWQEVQTLDPEGAVFLNVNFPEDLEQAREMVRQKCGV
jgi:molybdopterin-guanine dinucleotide biosynthesis protein A